MSDAVDPDGKLMRLRFDGVCRLCGVLLPAGSMAVFEPSVKSVCCASHADSPRAGLVAQPVIDPGTPGGSARREFDRRRKRREQRIRDEHPRIGGMLHRLSGEPRSTTAWHTGAIGEEQLGGRLNQLVSDRLRVIHDRRIPGTRTNIDHLAVTPSGVYVIDAKKYAGRPRLKVEGGMLRPRVEKLLVGTRDCSHLVDGVLRQVEIVRGAVGPPLRVHGVLCFVGADWPLIGGSFTTREVEVLWPRRLYPMLKAEGSSTIETISETHRLLAAALPPA